MIIWSSNIRGATLSLLFIMFFLISFDTFSKEREEGWYIGTDIGVSNYQDKSLMFEDVDRSLTGGINFGFQLNNYFDIEASYQYLGDFRVWQVSQDLTISQYALTSRLNFPFEHLYINPYISLTLGQQVFSELRGSKPDSNSSRLFSIGTYYPVSKNVSLSFEYQWADKFTYNNKYDRWLIGVKWYFNKSETVNEQRFVSNHIPSVVINSEQDIKTKESKSLEQVVLVHFDSNSSYFKDDKWVSNVMEIIDNNDVHIDVIGHTDNRGATEYNLWISERRARRVTEKLLSLGLDKHRITTKWFGSVKPMNNNETSEERANNRRVVIRVFSSEY